MKTLIANWKMNVGIRESVALARGTLLTVRGRKVIPDLIICPPFVALAEVRKVVARSAAKLGAQNMSWEPSGALTGEISSRMLQELGVAHVILGHSERRHQLGETNEMIQKKISHAFAESFTPILCVGETKEQRDVGEAKQIVRTQLASAYSEVKLYDNQMVYVAYEPVWAIGTSDAAEVPDVLEMHEYIRTILAEIFPTLPEENFHVLYGGSVEADNAYLLLRERQVDGVLVGGASVRLNHFHKIVDACVDVLEAQQ